MATPEIETHLEKSNKEFNIQRLQVRSAYREGQRDMLMKIKSIAQTYVMGEGDQCRTEILAYCENYIPETELDRIICQDNIKLLK